MFDISCFFQFTKWQCIQKEQVSGQTVHINITDIYRAVTNLIWAFDVFQTNRLNDQLKNNSEFDYANVKNLWFEVDRKRKPEDFWNLDFDCDYVLAYDAFQDFKKRFFKTDSPPYIDSIPYVDNSGFKKLSDIQY